MLTALALEPHLLLRVIHNLPLVSICRLEATCSLLKNFIALHQNRIRAHVNLRIIIRYCSHRDTVLEASRGYPESAITIAIEEILPENCLVSSVEELDEGVQLYKLRNELERASKVFAFVPNCTNWENKRNFEETACVVLGIVCRSKLQGFHFDHLNGTIMLIQAFSDALPDARIRAIHYPYLSYPNAEKHLLTLVNGHACEELRLLEADTSVRRLSKDFLRQAPSLRRLIIYGARTWDSTHVEIADEDFPRLDVFRNFQRRPSLPSYRGLCSWIQRKLEDDTPGEVLISTFLFGLSINDVFLWELLRQELQVHGIYGIFDQKQRSGYFLSFKTSRVVRLQLESHNQGWRRGTSRLSTEGGPLDLSGFIASMEQARKLEVDIRILEKEAEEKFYLRGRDEDNRPLSVLHLNVSLSDLLYFGQLPEWTRDVKLLIFQDSTRSLTAIPTKPVGLTSNCDILELIGRELTGATVAEVCAQIRTSSVNYDNDKLLRDMQVLFEGRRLRRLRLQAAVPPSEDLLTSIIQEFHIAAFSFHSNEPFSWRLSNEFFDVTPSLHSFSVQCEPTDDLIISITDSQLQRMLKFKAPHAQTEVTERGVAAWRETYRFMNMDEQLPNLRKASICFVSVDGVRIK